MQSTQHIRTKETKTMGTRGFTGFVIDGEREMLQYNHWDSYPSGVGVEVLTWLRDYVATAGTDHLAERVRALEVVNEEATPTPEQIERLKPFTDLTVSSQDVDDWYCLLRETQGKPGLTLDAGFTLSCGSFPTDSLFCEWGYLIDMDQLTFEVYKGFQTEPHELGRFAKRRVEDEYSRNNGYQPVALVGRWPLDDLPTNEAMVAFVDPPEDEE